MVRVYNKEKGEGGKEGEEEERIYDKDSGAVSDSGQFTMN